MKRQSREVYGYGAKLRTVRRFPPAWAVLVIVVAGMAVGAVWA